MNRFKWGTVAVWLLFFIGLAVNCAHVYAGPKAGDKAPDFVLENINDRKISLKDSQGEIVVLIIGGRDAKDEMKKWEDFIGKEFNSGTRAVKLLSMAAIKQPFFVSNSMVKTWIKKMNPPDFLLLDFGGKVAETYGVSNEEVPFLFVIDRGQVLCHTAASACTETAREQIAGQVRRLLKQ